ncbi:restriction endonuclease subunit S [Campylobacter jejuni]|nr:restriction endonuclease subunit S [Campylobacter jejuni]EAK3673376.1 restriction endonuclease subunit S [Campylobacter jejuni]EAL5948822.1 restriction endonuclease subunit S [Campylobacter jejuni]EKQ0670400.1 restriction endonuclease subunit S [Campylobacter jejuni]
MTNLPQGWEVKTIEEVCKNSSSNLALKDIKDKNGDYPVFGASGIVGYVDFYHKDKECLSIVKDGAGVGRVFVLPKNSSVIGTLNYLENFENTNLKYLFYFLHSIDFSKYILGSAIPHIYFRDYKKEQIPLPPLKEQERIVGILDFAFSKIDENIKKAKENLANIDEFMQSALQKAFNPLNNDTKENYQLPQFWEWKSLGEIGNTSSGGTPLRNKKEYWENGSIKWLKSGELNDGYIDFIEENITEEAIENSSAKIFQKGTLLIAMYGATAGRLGILNLDSATNQAVCAFLHKDNKNIKFLEKFLFYFLFFIRDKIIKDSFGGAQPNISQTYIKNLQIPLPLLQEQEQIAKHLDFVFEKTKALKELYTKELKDYEELKQSLLNKAFKGEL